LAADLPLDFEKLTWRVIFAYKPRADSTLYGSVSTGFRSGIGQTPAVIKSQPGFGGIVNPDTLTTYELGAKGRLLDGVLTYETAVYYMKWEDIPQALTLPIGFAARVNASGASGSGAEATLAYQPTPALTLHAGIGWNDLKFDQNVLQHVGPPAPLGQDVVLFAQDARINDSPEWTGSVGGSYRAATPMANMDFVMSSNLAYGSVRQQRSLSGATLIVNSSQDISDLKASMGLQGDRWSLDLYGDNLLDDGDKVEPPQASRGLTSVRLRPRTIGLQVAFDF
jgi:outer membrane receptor protein involved in Fe transport